MVHVGKEGDVKRIIPVRRTVQYTAKQEVVVEGKVQPKVLLGVRRGKGSTRTVRNGVLDP